MSQTPPEAGWMIQDLDMMYPPQDRLPAYQVKDESGHEACAYGPSSGQPQPSASSGAPYAAGQYGVVDDCCYGGEWPADLDNIHLDCDLPTEADSPLNLENYNITKVVFVDPATQSPNPEPSLCTSTPYQGSTATPNNKYSSLNPVQGYGQTGAPVYYDQSPLVTMETIEAEVTPITSSIPDSQRDVRTQPRRGRPRAEWRINKRGPGRPRNKPGRKPTLGVVKTELTDNEENMYPDILEEKRERRREQNRRAARKLREKKKVHVEHMKQNYEHILSENRRLSSEIDSLKRIINELESAKKNHICMCTNYTSSPPPSSLTSQQANVYVSGSDSRSSYGDTTVASNTSSMTSSSSSSSNAINEFL